MDDLTGSVQEPNGMGVDRHRANTPSKGPSATYGWGWVGCVSKQSKKQAQSWDFVQFLANEENGRVYASQGCGVCTEGPSAASVPRYYGDIRTLAGSLIWKAMAGKTSTSDALDQLEKQVKTYGARKK